MIPLRCKRCGVPIQKKVHARTPSYCKRCREAVQRQFKEEVARQRVARAREDQFPDYEKLEKISKELN